MKLARLLSHIRSALWVLPVTCVLVGACLSFAALALDRRYDYKALPTSVVGGPEAATAILETVATSMVSLTALVLTVTMVVVQLAMGQFSPRIVQRVLQDKPSQLAIGLFVATFVHAIIALRDVKSDPGAEGQVPGVAVATAFVLVIVSIAVLVVYVHHIGRSLRVSALIELVGRDTRALIDRAYPRAGKGAEDRRPEPAIVRALRSGVLTEVGHKELVEQARQADCRLEVLPALGEFVPAGAPLLRVHGDPSRLDERRLQKSFIMQLERTLDHDVAYGIRLLVDIAERSLADSPLQDPTTTVQAIDRLHDILRQLALRPFPSGEHRDAAGVVRLTEKLMSWDAYVHLAFDEIRMAGAGSLQVARRLKAALADLRTTAPPDRVRAIDEQLERLEAAVKGAISDEHDAALLLGEDRLGLGPDAARSTQT
jgi:uncharacterized membrane protein